MDRVPDRGPDQSACEVLWVTAGQIDQSRACDGFDVRRIESVLPYTNVDDHLLNAETLRGLGAQIVPACRSDASPSSEAAVAS